MSDLFCLVLVQEEGFEGHVSDLFCLVVVQEEGFED